MSNVSEILNAFFKSVEYSGATNLGVSKIEQDLYALLKSHAVIDKDSAQLSLECILECYYPNEKTHSLCRQLTGEFESELSRLSTTHKGEIENDR